MSPVIVVVVAGLILTLVLSVVCFAVYAVDKSAARKGTRRVPERILLTLGFFGGWPGGLIAQRALRHKTRKQPFRTHFVLTVVASLVVAVLVVIVTVILGPDAMPLAI